MAVIAFIDQATWTSSTMRYAAWAAISLDQPLSIVAREASQDSDPVVDFDAYQSMDAREDMFRELSVRSQSDPPQTDTAAFEIVQSAARKARDFGVEKVRTTTTSEPFPWYIENSTDSGDLLVMPRQDDPESSSRQWLDQFLKVRSRVMLAVPERYSPVESWLIALDGKPSTGRAVDFLCNHELLKHAQGTAVFVGNDYQNRIHFRDAVRHLASSGHKVKSHELQGNADDVLSAVLAVSPVDLLIMGAYGQGRFRLLNERSTTSRLLKDFRGPVLVARA